MLPKILLEYIRSKGDRSPRGAYGPFRTDPQTFATPPASGLRVTWFGHSSLLIEIDGARLLIDPVWDKRASPFEWSGPKRFFPATIALQDLPKLDAVLISHDHFDHLGARTVRSLAQLGSRWITSLGVGSVLQRFGASPDAITELDWTESVAVAGLNITALPARHFSGRSLLNRFETLWSSFVLRGPHHNVYYGADSGYWDGFAEIGRRYGPFDLTMLEIGAHNKLWEAIHMGPEGAAKAFAALGAPGLLMPIHWGMFELAPQDWREPIETMRRLAAQRGWPLCSPKLGEPADVMPNQALLSDWWKTP